MFDMLINAVSESDIRTSSVVKMKVTSNSPGSVRSINYLIHTTQTCHKHVIFKDFLYGLCQLKFYLKLNANGQGK